MHDSGPTYVLKEYSSESKMWHDRGLRVYTPAHPE